jgi:energy-coupling factor transporter ATP-binding protein EcfA2
MWAMTTKTRVVKVQDLTYAYPGNGSVLQAVTFEVKKGEMLGIIGPNGAGKSTLCKSLNGLVPHFYGGSIAGTVTIADMNTMQHSVADLSLKVGLVFQDPTNQFSGVSTRVDEEVAFGMSMWGYARDKMQPRIKEALHVVGLEGLEDRSPYELSGGQQQRLAIATVLAVRPEIIVMDEPTAQLDPVGKTEVLQTMRDLNGQGYTIIVAEHEIEALATFADRIIVLDGGRLIDQGATRDVLTKVRKLKDIGVDPPSVTELCEILSEELGITQGEFPIALEEATELFSQRLGARTR